MKQKWIGIATLCVGILGILLALSMDTTNRGMHNIGKLSFQQNALFLSIAITLAGLAIFLTRPKLNAGSEGKQTPSSDAFTAMRNCPFCAEEIRTQAILCRFCKNEVEPVNSTPNIATKTSPLQGNRSPDVAHNLTKSEKIWLGFALFIGSVIAFVNIPLACVFYAGAAFYYLRPK